jgi:FtsH-binding integral membrane protein
MTVNGGGELGEAHALLGDDRMSDLQMSSVRRNFVRKVYGILGLQMILTVAMVLPFYFFESLQVFVRVNPGIVWVAMFSTMAFMCAISCNPQIGRTFPLNMWILAGFTICEAFLIGVICVNSTGVLLAAMVTCAIVLALTAFAMVTDIDFTGYGVYLFVALIGLITVQLFAIFLQLPWLDTLVALLGAVIFSFYLVHDTQTIVDGKHNAYSISVDDYIFASLVLYLDIINLFLNILHLIGGGRD